MRRVFAEGDQAGKWRYQCAYAADIYAEQQAFIISRKFGKQDSRRHVADKLAGEHGKQKCIFREDFRDRFPYDGNAGCVSRKNKEKHKSEQQCVIHVFQRFFIQQKKRGDNYGKPDIIWNDAEYHNDSQREKGKIYAKAFFIKRRLFARKGKRLFFNENHAAKNDRAYGKKKGRQHDQGKFARGDIEFSVQI